MSTRREGRRDPVDRAKLALTHIEHNRCFTAHEAWSWYVLPTQPWAFRSDTQREQLLYGAGEALAWLAGHRLRRRAPPEPYPSAAWARGLDERTPAPLSQTTGDSWGDHLVAMQQHLRHQTMAEKKVFLGVRLRSRARSHRMLAVFRRRPSYTEHARLLPLEERVTEAIGLPGMEGRPASSAEMEWLLRRSVGLGLPAPASLCPAGSAEWDPEDLHSFTDDVDYTMQPFGRTVQVGGRGAKSSIERHGGGVWGGSGAKSWIERHVAVMSVGRLEEIEAPDPGHEPWLAHTDRLPFPVEWSAQFDVLSGGDARQAIPRKLLVVRA